jgi:hypothetical protein
VIPQQPLRVGVKYVVTLTVNGNPYTWSFSVGPFGGCLAASLSAAPASPSLPGTVVNVTASAPGCANPLYQFWTLAPGASSWQVAQPYSTTASFAWDTTGKATGGYSIAVWVKGASSTGIYGNQFGRWDTSIWINYRLIPPACTGLSLSAAPPSTTAVGTTAMFTAGGTCPDPNPVYQFFTLAPGASSWTVAQPYSSSNSFSWNTGGKAPGNYQVAAWVRDANSTGAFSNVFGSWDASSSRAYTVTTCTALGLSAPAWSAGVGAAVSLTATAGGCPDPNPVYQFFTLGPGASSWTVAQPYSSSNSFSWSTAGRVPGSYQVAVWVRDASSGGVYSNSFGSWDLSSVHSFSLTTCSGLSLGAVAAGTAVTFTASAVGCPNPNPVYQFWVLAPGASSWTMVQAYSTSNTFSWSTVGKAKGTYHIAVWARDASSAGTYSNSLGTWDASVSSAASIS